MAKLEKQDLDEIVDTLLQGVIEILEDEEVRKVIPKRYHVYITILVKILRVLRKIL